MRSVKVKSAKRECHKCKKPAPTPLPHEWFIIPVYDEKRSYNRTPVLKSMMLVCGDHS